MATQVSLNSGAVASAGALALQTNGTTTAVTIDTSQNVGLGVTPTTGWYSTAKAIQMGTTGAVFGRTGNEIVGLTSNAYNSALATTTYRYIAGGNYATNYLQTTGQHQWFNAGIGTNAGDLISFTQAMTLNASGGLQTLNTIGVGNTTPSTSGAGITFPATQSASTDANTLDDYEEGTWTPTPDGNFTYTDSVFTGNYTKIGRLVNVNMRIVTTTGNVAWISGASVTGLPFTAATNRAGSWSNIANFTEGGFCGVQSTSITMITARTASADNFDVSVTYFV
jgi:hypothetical protein